MEVYISVSKKTSFLSFIVITPGTFCPTLPCLPCQHNAIIIALTPCTCLPLPCLNYSSRLIEAIDKRRYGSRVMRCIAHQIVNPRRRDNNSPDWVPHRSRLATARPICSHRPRRQSCHYPHQQSAVMMMMMISLLLSAPLLLLSLLFLLLAEMNREEPGTAVPQRTTERRRRLLQRPSTFSSM